jgi:hypothetical protein
MGREARRMYVISQYDNGVFFGEILETGYYAENESWMEVQKELEEHDINYIN